MLMVATSIYQVYGVQAVVVSIDPKRVLRAVQSRFIYNPRKTYGVEIKGDRPSRTEL